MPNAFLDPSVLESLRSNKVREHPSPPRFACRGRRNLERAPTVQVSGHFKEIVMDEMQVIFGRMWIGGAFINLVPIFNIILNY